MMSFSKMQVEAIISMNYMVFYTAGLVRQLNNPTIVVITDRNDLDDQLFSTFAKSDTHQKKMHLKLS